VQEMRRTAATADATADAGSGGCLGSGRRRCRIVILGGGITGVATAYYLGHETKGVVLVEQSKVGAAASGKAGGFLARGWGTPGITQQLHERGFDLHEKLAQELNLKSFRKLPTLEVAVLPSNQSRTKRAKTHVDTEGETSFLLNSETTKSSMMDPDTAQVTPMELVTNLWKRAEAAGAELVIDKASNLAEDNETGELIVDLANGGSLVAEKVVLAMGPWTTLAEDWNLPLSVKIPIVGIASSSMIVRSQVPVTPSAVFCSEDENQCHLEIYPRPDQTLYVCGFGGSPHLGKKKLSELGPDDVRPNETRLPSVKRSFSHIAAESISRSSETDINCCLRPCTEDSVPMIGKLSENLLIGTGGNCWGILWGPAIGMALANLTLGKSPEIELKPFDPFRFSKA